MQPALPFEVPLSNSVETAAQVPSAQPARAPRFYQPELDLLRFVAFLLVFVHHLLPETLGPGHSELAEQVFETIKFASGNGLSLFFLLSSYLITELLLREQEATGTIAIKSFYIRRILRIWPLYFAFITFGFLLGFANKALHISFAFLAEYALLLGNLAFYHNPTINPIGPLWSISVEEQFYLCWPSVARAFGRRGILYLSLALIPISIVTSAWLTRTAVHPGFAIWMHSLTEFECFGAGALLALALHHRRWMPGLASRLALFGAGVAVWVVSDGYFHYKAMQMLPVRELAPQIIGFQLIPLGSCLIFLGFLGTRVSAAGFRPLLYLGRISYGLYVYHIFARYVAMRMFSTLHIREFAALSVPSFLLMATALGITIVLAMLSYQFFEKPFLRLKERFTIVKTRVT